MDNYVGKRLDGRYEIQEIVGVGGMSVVYKAYDNVDDRIVAVKVLKEEFLNNEEFKRRFKNESKAIALLSHPNIVKVYDVNFGEKLQYIVMEYIDGITLKEYINKQGAITWNDALFFMNQILRAVQHAHDKGIVHRDIKPQNIILLPNGNIKVTDFGIARFSRSETKTLTENAIGSVHYIAPEQAKGEFTDEKADIYSIGVVLYEMLAGRVPFEADSAVSVALMQLQADAKKLTDINPDIPLGLEQICIHAMEKNPRDRYQTATEMLFDLEEIIKNPNTTFNYSAKLDSNPTRIVKKEDVINSYQNNEPVEEEAEVEYTDPEHKKKVATAIVIGIIVLIAAVVLLVMGVTGSLTTKTVTMPNFYGLSYDELVEDSNYNFEFVREDQETDDVDAGTVVGQNPEAGTKIQEGNKVTLYVAVSTGTNSGLTVPSVYNKTVDQAKIALSAAGITNFEFVEQPHDTFAEGTIFNSEPKAGESVDENTKVILYVSSGPSTTVTEKLLVPSVEGLTKSGARAFLEKYGFTNINFVTQDSEYDKDIVISQSPSAGEYATADSTIKVIISSGETTTKATPSVKASVTITLPECIGEDGKNVTDTLKISVGNETYLNQKVTLDGKKKIFSIYINSDMDSSNIVVTLEDTGAIESFTIDSTTENQSFTVDFSAYSVDESTSDDATSNE